LFKHAQKNQNDDDRVILTERSSYAVCFFFGSISIILSSKKILSCHLIVALHRPNRVLSTNLPSHWKNQNRELLFYSIIVCSIWLLWFAFQDLNKIHMLVSTSNTNMSLFMLYLFMIFWSYVHLHMFSVRLQIFTYNNTCSGFWFVYLLSCHFFHYLSVFVCTYVIWWRIESYIYFIAAKEKVMAMNLEFMKATVTAEEVQLFDPLHQVVLTTYICWTIQQIPHKDQPEFHEPVDEQKSEMPTSTGREWLHVLEAAESMQSELSF